MIRIQKHLVFSVALILCFCELACVYSFSGANLGSLKTVAVPTFENQTSEPRIRERLTEKVIDAFVNDNNLKVSDPKSAQSVVNGVITRIDDGPFTATGSGNQFTATNYKLTVYAKVSFNNLAENKVVWESEIIGFAEYTLDGNGRDEALETALETISNEIINKTISGW